MHVLQPAPILCVGAAKAHFSWHHTGSGKLHLNLGSKDYQVMEELWKDALPASDAIPADKRRYVKTKLPIETLIAAFQKAELTDVKEG